MIKIRSAAQMKAADPFTIEEKGVPSLTLMERAARAVLGVLTAHFKYDSVLVLCGSGNNGGDGFALARMLHQRGCHVRVCYPAAWGEDGTPDKSAMSEACAAQLAALPAEIEITHTPSLEGVDTVVDALFGFGLSRPVEGELAAAIDAVNASGLPVLSIDLPSGVCADTGRVLGTAIRAAITVCITSEKQGQRLFPAADHIGMPVTVDIGVQAPEDALCSYLLEARDIAALPERPATAHKGSCGRVLVIGGSRGMAGAAHLSAKAAYRMGAGYVEIFAPQENRLVHQIALPEAILSLYDADDLDEAALLAALSRADAVAIGMGLSTSPVARRMVGLTLQHARVPLVLDADALNLISASKGLSSLLRARTAPSILTPHPAEAARLLATTVQDLQEDLFGSAATLAEKFGAISVLKGARTVIHNGKTAYLNCHGNCGMATAGSGDVLSGVIAALLADKCAPEKAAYLGVLAHALAGDAAAAALGARAVMASDIIDKLGDTIR